LDFSTLISAVRLQGIQVSMASKSVHSWFIIHDHWYEMLFCLTVSIFRQTIWSIQDIWFLDFSTLISAVADFIPTYISTRSMSFIIIEWDFF
jgi:hypothetical protein